jgi:hypothetical protein
MKERSRVVYDPGYTLDLHFKSLDQTRHPVTGLLNYPDYNGHYYVYPIHRSTQLQRYEPSTVVYKNQAANAAYNRKIWKGFQNYTIVSGSAGGKGVTLWDKSQGSPPAHVFSASPPIPSDGAYWLFTPVQDVPIEPFGEAGKYNLPTTINGRAVCPPYIYDDYDESFVVPPSNLAALHYRAMSEMMPRIKEELSSLNSLYELKDFKSLQGIAKTVGRAAYNGSLIRLATKAVKSTTSTLRELSRTSASGFLQWKFAVAPLISDIRSIHTALNRYKTRIDELVSKTGGRQRKHFTYNWREHEDTTDETSAQAGLITPYLHGNGCVTYQITRDIQNSPSTFHAEVEYNYNYSNYQLQNAAVLSLLDALGVNFSPRIIWDALPFSFLVDWVLKVGQSLDQFEIKNMEPQINMHRLLWSIKRERTISCKIKPSYQTTDLEGSLDRTPVSLPVVRETVYGRDLGYPLVPSLIETSGISRSEFTLGAAIVIAQGKRRRTKK